MRLAFLFRISDATPIRELNPTLLRSQVPPAENRFRVKIPAGHATIFAEAYQKYETTQAQLVTHEVKKGETIFSIARRYGQRVKALMELNGLANPTVRVGQRLKVIMDGLRGGIR